jgi:flagellar hook protein FlgE
VLSIYGNLKKTRTWQTEKRGGQYTIVEMNFNGDIVKAFGNYLTRDVAEKALANFADDSGYRWIGKQEAKD